jgi:putative endonuclease
MLSNSTISPSVFARRVSPRTRRGNPGLKGLNTFIFMKDKVPCVYILASQKNGTLYVGVTSDLAKRVSEHKNESVESFTKRYGVHNLVYYEVTNTMDVAIAREKQIKAGSRKNKLKLVEKSNPEWKDLFDNLQF